MSEKAYSLVAFTDVYDMNIFVGIITEVSETEDKANITISDIGNFDGVTICYHCQNSATFDGGRAAFAIGDEVYILNKGGKCTPNSSDLTIIGFTDGIHLCGTTRDLIIILFTDPSLVDVVSVWDPITNSYAENIPRNGGAGMATFPCRWVDISDWIGDAQSIDSSLWGLVQTTDNTNTILSRHCTVPSTGNECEYELGINCGNCNTDFNFACPLPDCEGGAMVSTASSSQTTGCEKLCLLEEPACKGTVHEIFSANIKASPYLASSYKITYINGSGVISSLYSTATYLTTTDSVIMNATAVCDGNIYRHNALTYTTGREVGTTSPWGDLIEKVTAQTLMESEEVLVYDYLYNGEEIVTYNHTIDVTQGKKELIGKKSDTILVQAVICLTHIYTTQQLSEYGPMEFKEGEPQKFWVVSTCSYHEEGTTGVDPTGITRNSDFENALYETWQKLYEVNGSAGDTGIYLPTISCTIVNG